jgi:hypothetical protein
MGTGIAQVAAAAGGQVILIDINQTLLSKAVERIGSGYDRLVAKGQMSPEAKQTALGLIATGIDYVALTSADLVIEAATENADVKIGILQAVEGGLCRYHYRHKHPRFPSPGLPRASQSRPVHWAALLQSSAGDEACRGGAVCRPPMQRMMR